jgi:hypothetical protein
MLFPHIGTAAKNRAKTLFKKNSMEHINSFEA